MRARTRPKGRSSEVCRLLAQSPRLGKLAQLGQAHRGDVARVQGRGHALAEALAQEIAGKGPDGLAKERDGPPVVAALAVRVAPRRARGGAQAHVAHLFGERVRLLAHDQSLAGITGKEVGDCDVREHPRQPPPIAEGSGQGTRFAQIAGDAGNLPELEQGAPEG
jgi:hypothetical protein